MISQVLGLCAFVHVFAQAPSPSALPSGFQPLTSVVEARGLEAVNLPAQEKPADGAD